MKQLKIMPKEEQPEPTIYEEDLLDFGEGAPHIGTRTAEEFKNKAFFLTPAFNWHLGVDSTGHIVLVPTRKGVK